jgi:hypothetical protein
MFGSAWDANDRGDVGIIAEGTREHVRELRAIAGHGEVCHPCTALLRYDPLQEEPFVAVIIGESPVGHLSRDDAKRYCARLGTATRGCRAVIMAIASEPWNVDVWIDLELDG